MYPTSVARGLNPYATTIAKYKGVVVPATIMNGNARFVQRGKVNRCRVIELRPQDEGLALRLKKKLRLYDLTQDAKIPDACVGQGER
jgi:hypothetical protein